jgi:transcription elongation factor GreA
MEKIPMTRAGFDALDAELKHLKSVERPAIIRAIAEAREHGDLSENAEYHAAAKSRASSKAASRSLRASCRWPRSSTPPTLSGAIKFGATVTLVDEDTDEEKTYQIVGETEADIENGLLNIRSPLARALIGKDMDDLRPDRARPEVWRAFAQGARGPRSRRWAACATARVLALTAGGCAPIRAFARPRTGSCAPLTAALWCSNPPPRRRHRPAGRDPLGAGLHASGPRAGMFG